MEKKNALEQAKARTEELIRARNEQLADIEQKLAAARAEANTADQATKAATIRTDVEAYFKAKGERDRAAAAVEMYTARAAQLQNSEIISETESNAVIDSLLKYEQDITAEYLAKLKKALGELYAIQKEYTDGVQDTENTIARWTSEVHPNYRSMYATYANGTNRSDRPIPVRPVQYSGCPECHAVHEFFGMSVIEKMM